MAKKTIRISLSEKSIKNALKELDRHRQELRDRNIEFLQKLAEAGIPVINHNIASALGDSNKNHNTYIKLLSFGTEAQAKLVCEGRDILFIEFGAGVHYNGSAGGSPHPKGQEMGYTIGSYGKGQGKNDFWFFYADTGEAVMSRGTEAAMPMYKASIEVIQKVRSIASEVFGR